MNSCLLRILLNYGYYMNWNNYSGTPSSCDKLSFGRLSLAANQSRVILCFCTNSILTDTSIRRI